MAIATGPSVPDAPSNPERAHYICFNQDGTILKISQLTEEEINDENLPKVGFDSMQDLMGWLSFTA